MKEYIKVGCTVSLVFLMGLFLAQCPAPGGGGENPPPAPVIAAAAGNSQVTISWTAVAGATSYNLYWSKTSGVTKTNGTKIANATSPYVHKGLANGTTCYYVATAQNSGGESAESAQVSATPSSPAIPVTSVTVMGTGGATTISTPSGTLQMIATVLPANATDPTVVWSVADGTGHATISATGLLSAVDNGTVTVKATAHDGSGIFGTEVITLTNQPTVPVASITVAGTGGVSTISAVSGTLQMIATALPGNATDPTVVWSVVDGTGHATISATGLLSAVDNGAVTVKAAAHDGSGVFGTRAITISQPVGTLVIDWHTDSGQTASATNQLYYQVSTDQFFMDNAKLVRGDHNTGAGNSSTSTPVTATLYPGTYYVRGWYDAAGNTPALSATDGFGYWSTSSHGVVVAAAPTVVANGSSANITLNVERWGTGAAYSVWPANPVYLKVNFSYSGGNAVNGSHSLYLAFGSDPTLSGFTGVYWSPSASTVTLLCILNSATSYYLMAFQDAAGVPSSPAVNDPVLIYNNKGLSLTNGVTGGGPDAISATSNMTINLTVTDNIRVTP